METKANHLLIGSFILLIFALAFAFTYWVERFDVSRSSKVYEILFHGPVSGLSQASSVLFNGIRAGKVSHMEIYSKDSRKVRVLVYIQKDMPIKTNSRARLEYTGVTGFAVIQVTAGTPDAEALRAKDGAEYPQIKSDVSTADSLLKAAPEVLGNANAVFIRLNDLIANNEDTIRNSLLNIESFAKTLDDNKENISTVIEEAKVLSIRLNALATKIETTVDSLSSFMTIDNQSFFKKLEETVNSFRRLALKLETSINEKTGDIILKANKSLQEFEAFMQDGQKAARNLNRILENLEEDPGGFVFGGSKVPEYNSSE